MAATTSTEAVVEQAARADSAMVPAHIYSSTLSCPPSSVTS